MVGHTFHPDILRAYDIRGTAGHNLHTTDAYALGCALAIYLAKPAARVVVGRDGRLTSPEMSTALIQGLIESGIHVIDVGLGPSPALYFAQHNLQADAGVMVTASHNPRDDNGFKICVAGRVFCDHDLQRLAEIAKAGQWIRAPGSLQHQDIHTPYLNYMLQDFFTHQPPQRALRIAWDPGNGAAGPLLSALIERLPGEHFLIHATVDGRFPHHHPDPAVPENLRELQALVQQNQCDFGFAFDGDGDRLGVVDSQGRVIPGDLVIVAFAQDILKHYPRAPIIIDIRSSEAAADLIRQSGGKPLFYRTGHAYIKAYMRETGAPVAGELSGHMFFSDRYFGFDDALYAALRFISRFGQPSETATHWHDQVAHTSVTRDYVFPSTRTAKHAAIEEVRRLLNAQGASFICIDGLRVQRPQGWWLLRASNTQDCLGARLESPTAHGAQALEDDMMASLQKSGVCT